MIFLASMLIAQAEPVPGDPDYPGPAAMFCIDLGRRVPFGRTFDVYIATGNEITTPSGRSRPPYQIGSSYGDEPSRGFGWIIEGELFRNRNEALYPWLDNCPECIEWFKNYPGGGVDLEGNSCEDYGVQWGCWQSNPNQKWGYLEHRSFPVNWGMNGCCPNFGAGGWKFNLPYFWADSWLLMNSIDQPDDNPSTPNRARPVIMNQHKDILDDGVFKFWPAYGDLVGLRCCSSASSIDRGQLIQWSTGIDWESEEYPGCFRIARLTGPDYFGSGGLVRFAFGQGYDATPESYSLSYYPDNSCPSDLNEDGIVGYQDLLQVLADVGAYRYNPQTDLGFQAILKVLSEWGDCP